MENRLWGAVIVCKKSCPQDTEERLEKFTELVATAVANAREYELAASRRRIVAASDETRRQIERDLHDGTQQRLVSLGLAVRAAEASLPPERDDLRAQLSGVAQGLVAAVEDLQEISRGIHPAILSKGGLAPALRALVNRSAIPVDLEITADIRLAEPIEVAAYFVASEALANAAKHSQASRIDVSLEQCDGSLVLSVADDGVGGADASRGSGLIGLTDRVEALGGTISIVSHRAAAPHSPSTCLRRPSSSFGTEKRDHVQGAPVSLVEGYHRKGDAVAEAGCPSGDGSAEARPRAAEKLGASACGRLARPRAPARRHRRTATYDRRVVAALACHGLDPTDLLAPIEADESEVLERWFEHPLGSLTHVLTEQLRKVAEESRSMVVVTDASGLVLHRVGEEWLKERAADR